MLRQTDTTSGPQSNRTFTQVPEELSVKDIGRFLRRRWIWIVCGAILGLIGGVYSLLRAPKLYTSTTTVELNKDSSSGLGLQDFSGIASQLGSGSSEFSTDMMTHQYVLSNANTALSVISDLDLMHERPYSDIPAGKLHDAFVRESSLPLNDAPMTRDRALAIFNSGLQVTIVKSTRLLTISYTDTDRNRATRIANAVVQAYLKNHTEARYVATSRASEWLANQLDALKRKVEQNHKEVSAFQQQAGVLATALPPTNSKSGSGGGYSPAQDPNSTAVQRLLALNAELSRAEVARIEREAIYRLTQTDDVDSVLNAAKTSLVTSLDSSPLTSGGKNIQLLENLRAQASALKIQLAADQVRFGARYPAVLEAQNELNSINAQSHDEVQRINGQAKTDYLFAKSNEDALRKSVEEQQRTVFSLGSNLSTLAFLQQEELTSRGLYQDLYTRLEEANIAAGVKSTDMVVVDPARPPSMYSSPVPSKKIALGLAAGLVLGFLVGLIIHLLDTALQTSEEFESASTFPQLGVIPAFSSNKGAYGATVSSAEAGPAELSNEKAWIIRVPKSNISESYRQIRSSILLSSVDTPPQVILFTSPLSGDGKSTTAYNLAASFGVQAKRVLLIDADMRRPTIQAISGCTSRVGLSDLLTNDLPLDQVIQPHPNLPSLFVMTSGSIPPMPAELLGSQKFSKLVEELRKQFDYILIDAPPILLVTDPILIASSADGIVVVLSSGRTTRHLMRDISKALAKPGVHVFGYVINRFSQGGKRYGYRYGYGYGYGAKDSYYDETPIGKK